jgi:uncharacterized protein
VIDAHVHIFPPEMIRDRESYLERDARFAALYRSPQARMATAEDVVAHMDETGVDLSVVFGYAFSDQGLCRLVNDYVIEAVAAHPSRLVGLACVWPRGRGAAAEAERCLEAGLRGCGELVLEDTGGQGPDGGAGRVGLSEVAQVLRTRRAPLLVHANEPVGHHYPGKGGFGPEACLTLARSFPGLTIVFAHLGGGVFLYEAMPEVREVLADVYYDTSAVPYLYDAGIYEAVLVTAGPHKLIFGSDYPLLSPGRYDTGLDRLSPSARAMACGGNARKVFGI